jgi:hypothetical protein
MKGNTIIGDLTKATISLTETKGQGNDKAMQICSPPCNAVGTLVDTQHVSAVGLSQTVNQSFSVNNQAVGAIVIRSDDTVVAQGENDSSNCHWQRQHVHGALGNRYWLLTFEIPIGGGKLRTKTLWRL